MNFETMKQVAVAKAAGPSQAGRLLDVNELFSGAMVNEALHKIERTALWKFSEKDVLLTVERDSQVPAVPVTDLAVPLTARNLGTRLDLRFHDERQRFHFNDDPSSTHRGRIEEYGVWAGALRFYPVASQDEEIALRYYRSWPDLVDAEDEPLFPATWHDLLTDYAASKIILRLAPTEGKFLPESASRPYFESWANGLQAMLASDLVLTTFDKLHNHALEESMWRGEGADW